MNIIDNQIKNVGKLVSIIDNFFEEKQYENRHFLNDLQLKIFKDCNKKLDKQRIANLLTKYNNNKQKFNKFSTIINKKQVGGGDEEISSYTKILDIIDFFFDIMNIIPNDILSSNKQPIGIPYGILSLILNLLRSDYDFAFYSLLGLIPGLGSVVSLSTKVIHRIIKYITEDQKSKKKQEIYEQLQIEQEVNTLLDNPIKFNNESKATTGNPYIGDFIDEYE